MPCEHKFQSYLKLEGLDFQPTTLIVGTFNPSWPQRNNAQWFYGRTRNNCFWNILPRLYGEASLADATPNEWKAFCSRHRIAITDLISCILDANQDNPDHMHILGGYGDTQIADNFNDFEFTDIVGLLQDHPTIRYVYLTRGPGQFWNNLWLPVNALAELGEQIIKESKLLTPSKMARFSMAAYNKNNPEHPFVGPLCDYILGKWQLNWHEVEPLV